MALGTPSQKTLLAVSLAAVVAVLTAAYASNTGLAADIEAASKPASSAPTPEVPSSGPAVFMLSSFEEGGPDFVKGDGQVVAQHATDGKNAYKLTNDKVKYHNIRIEDGAPLAEVKSHHWLKADIFNPGDAPVAYGLKAGDGKSKFEKEGVAEPGQSTLIIDITNLPRAKGSGNLDPAKIREISLFIQPDKQEHSLFFDNIRFEGAADEKVPDFVLFDFENESDVAAWKAVELPGTRAKELPATVEWSTSSATSGKHAMKITFAANQFPTIRTASVRDAQWGTFASLRVDVTVSRPCVVGIRVTSERCGMDKTEFLQPGKNTIATLLNPAWGKTTPPLGGKVVGFDIYMYAPHEGESIVVDNIRLSAQRDVAHDDNFMVWPDGKPAFKVLGTDMTVTGIGELAGKLKANWARQESKSVNEIEAAFASRYDEFKKTHPKAVLAIFRDGQKGFDPKNPDKVYDGWRDAHINGHGPDSNLQGRASNTGKEKNTELFMRHRSRIIQVDLASIPKGSEILAAQMILICNHAAAATKPAAGQHADTVTWPSMWVAEACNRPWEEYEVNAYQYDKDKFWKAINGTYYGQDPDFLPLFVAYGPAEGPASWWDFTEAAKYWTDGSHENHGFFWYSTSMEDYFSSPTREVHDVASRPAMMVIYDPKQ